METWLTKAIKLESDGYIEESLNIIFDKLDEWLICEYFDRCSSFLRDVLIDELSISQLLTILTVTLIARTKLSERPSFVSRTRDELRRRGEDYEGLLFGLI